METEFSGSRELFAGVRDLGLNSRPDVLAVVWARAIEKGYSPFEPTKKQK